jgi:hypothetical protein
LAPQLLGKPATLTATRTQWEINMARPLAFAANRATSRTSGRNILVGSILLGLAALGMGEANAQAKDGRTINCFDFASLARQ